MKFRLASIAILVIMSIGYTHTKQLFVEVKAICNEQNAQGECVRWSVMNRGCKGPCSVKNKILKMEINNVTRDKTQSCSAKEGGSCNSSMNLEEHSTKTTVPVNAPCFDWNEQGECTKWGVVLRGCKAAPGTTCNVLLEYQNKEATCTCEKDARGYCTSAPGDDCTAAIPVKELA